MSTTLIQPPVPRSTPVAHQGLDPRERDRLIHRAPALSWLSLAYMTAEGAIAVIAALLAGSVAQLLGYGLDSAIEALASVIVIWRSIGTRRLSPAERHAERLVAISFFLFAPSIAQDRPAPWSPASTPHAG